MEGSPSICTEAALQTCVLLIFKWFDVPSQTLYYLGSGLVPKTHKFADILGLVRKLLKERIQVSGDEQSLLRSARISQQLDQGLPIAIVEEETREKLNRHQLELTLAAAELIHGDVLLLQFQFPTDQLGLLQTKHIARFEAQTSPLSKLAESTSDSKTGTFNKKTTCSASTDTELSGAVEAPVRPASVEKKASSDDQPQSLAAASSADQRFLATAPALCPNFFGDVTEYVKRLSSRVVVHFKPGDASGRTRQISKLAFDPKRQKRPTVSLAVFMDMDYDSVVSRLGKRLGVDPFRLRLLKPDKMSSYASAATWGRSSTFENMWMARPQQDCKPLVPSSQLTLQLLYDIAEFSLKKLETHKIVIVTFWGRRELKLRLLVPKQGRVRDLDRGLRAKLNQLWLDKWNDDAKAKAKAREEAEANNTSPSTHTAKAPAQITTPGPLIALHKSAFDKVTIHSSADDAVKPEEFQWVFRQAAEMGASLLALPEDSLDDQDIDEKLVKRKRQHTAQTNGTTSVREATLVPVNVLLRGADVLELRTPQRHSAQSDRDMHGSLDTDDIVLGALQRAGVEEGGAKLLAASLEQTSRCIQQGALAWALLQPAKVLHKQARDLLTAADLHPQQKLSGIFGNALASLHEQVLLRLVTRNRKRSAGAVDQMTKRHKHGHEQSSTGEDEDEDDDEPTGPRVCGPLRFMSVERHRIETTFKEDDLCPQQVHAEERPGDDLDIRPDQRIKWLVRLCGSAGTLHIYGHPVSLVVAKGQTLGQLKPRIRERLEMAKESFKQLKFIALREMQSIELTDDQCLDLGDEITLGILKSDYKGPSKRYTYIM